MTRIIAGRAGSFTLAVPDAGTRPTSDRVRESLFSALESADLIEGARVLDLYAGSGALGLEALSRGAAAVDLVEKNPRAASITQKNATRVAGAIGDPRAARVHRSAVVAYLRTAPGPFDLVLIDPPYDIPADDVALVLDLLAPLLSHDATVVVERASRSGAPLLPAGLEAVRDKRYGDTTLWWSRPSADA